MPHFSTSNTKYTGTTTLTSQRRTLAQLPFRASDRSRKKKSNFAGFLGTNLLKKRLILQKIVGVHQKAIGKKRPILWLFSRQISVEIDRFCADQTSIFNVFLTEVIICSFNKTHSRNEPMAKSLTSWLVPSFSQHNLRRVVSGRCLHVSVMKSKFQDKFASLRQVNSPY